MMRTTNRLVVALAVALLAVVVRAEVSAAAVVTVYVATDGSDANPGMRRKPLRTLEAAREKVRELKKRSGALPVGGVTVELAAGTYAVARPLVLTAEDAGTAEAPVTYRACPEARVVLSGSRTLADWQPVTDAAVLERLDLAARGKVFQADLRALSITEYGDLKLDAAWELQHALSVADNQNEDEIGNAMASREAVKRGRTVSPRLDLIFNGTPMELSRWPNTGFTKIGTVLGKTEINVRGVMIGGKEGIFTYTDNRFERWLKDKDAYVRGYWFRDWALQCHRIAAIDTVKRTLAVAPPYHFYGYTMDESWPIECDHRGISKLLRSPNLDMLSASHTYYRRKLGENGEMRQCLHGKLFFDERSDASARARDRPVQHMRF